MVFVVFLSLHVSSLSNVMIFCFSLHKLYSRNLNIVVEQIKESEFVFWSSGKF